MGKIKVKRKANDQENNADVSSKKPKKQTIFDVVEFKFLLKDKTASFQALERFIQQANKFPESCDYDIVSGYCTTSNGASELLQLFENSQKKPSELCLLFETIEVILLRTAADLKKFKLIGDAIVKLLLSYHLPCVYSMLAMNNTSNHIKSALRLLIAMVMQGRARAKDVLLHFDFHHRNVLPLLNRRDLKDARDVRTCFLQFVTSFLIVGDDDVINQLLEMKDVLHPIFDGLHADKATTVCLVLSSLLEKIVCNQSVTKTLKLRLFTEPVLKQIARLYIWKSASSWQDASSKKNSASTTEIDVSEDSLSDDQRTVKQACHEFLMELATSHTVGIGFVDSSYATSGRNVNRRLTALLCSLPRPHAIVEVGELVSSVIHAFPDQLHWYIPHLKTNLIPRDSSQWTLYMRLLIKILENLPQNLVTKILKLSVDSFQKVSMLLAIYLPPKDVWTSVCHAIRKPQLNICFESMCVLKSVLKKFGYILRSLAGHEDIMKHYREAMIKILPDLEHIIQCWRSAISFDKKLAIASEVKKDIEIGGDNHVNSSSSVSTVAIATHLSVLLEVLCLYQTTLPSLTRSSPINVASILQGIKSVPLTEDTDAVLFVLALRLLADSDIQQIAWLKTFGGSTTLYLVLEIIVRTRDNVKLNHAARQLVFQLLMGTHLFDQHGDELIVWLRELANEGVIHSTLEFMEHVLSEVFRRTLYYEEEIMTSVVSLLNSIDSDKSSHISVDEILALPQVNLEENNSAESKEKAASSRNVAIVPFSVIVPSCLQVSNSQTNLSHDVKDYLKRVFRQLLRQQLDCGSLALYLSSKCPQLILDDLALHLSPWCPRLITDRCNETSATMLLEAKRLSDLLEVIFESKQVVDDKVEMELLSRISDLLLEEIAPLSQQLVLYVNTLLNRKVTKYSRRQLLLFFKTFEQIVGKLSSYESHDSNEEKNEISTNLLIEQLKPHQVLQSIMSIVFENTLLIKYFLWQPTNTEENFDKKHCLSLCRLVTIALARFIVCSNKMSKVLLPEFVLSKWDIFMHKLEVYCSAEVFMSDEQDFFIETCLVLIPCLSNNVLNILIETLLSLPVKLLVNNELPEDNQLKRKELLHASLNRWLTNGPKSDHSVLLCNAVLPLAKIVCMQFDDYLATDLLGLVMTSEQHALAISQEIFEEVILKYSDKNVLLKVASCVVQVNKEAKSWLLSWLQDKKQSLTSEVKMSLLGVVLAAVSKDPIDKKLTSVMKKLFWNDLCEWVCSEMELSLGNETYTNALIFLLQHGQRQDVVDDMCTKLNQLLRQVPACQDQVRILNHLVNLDEKENLSVKGVDLVVTLVSTLPLLLKEQSTVTKSTLEYIVNVIVPHLKVLNCKKQIEQRLEIRNQLNSVWNGVVKNGLRYYYKNELFLDFLVHLIPVIYDDASRTSSEIMPLKSVYEMVLSHSQYLPTVLDEHTPLKDKLLKLQLTVAQLDCSGCQALHVGVLFGGYRATMNSTDRSILTLIRLHEQADCQLDQFKPYVWGPKAMELQRIRKNLGPSLWKQTTVEEVLSLFDEGKLEQSTLNFPLNINLQGDVVESDSLVNVDIDNSDVYDLCFLLPLFSHLLLPENVVDCRLFVEKGCLGYVMAGLSSHLAEVRGCSCHILTCFQQHLVGARFAEQPLITYLLECLRHSLPSPNKRLPPVISIFFAKAAKLLLNQANHLYMPIVEFLLLKPAVDIENIPEFYKLFNSSAPEFQAERLWMLSLLEAGLREPSDFHLYEKRYAFKLLLGFYYSSMSELTTQLQVLRVIRRACSMPRVVAQLIDKHLFFSWLGGTALQKKLTENHISLFSEILMQLFKILSSSKLLNSKLNIGQMQLIIINFSEIHRKLPCEMNLSLLDN